MKRLLCALVLLASSSAAYAEAGKGFSHISMGQVLVAIFVFGFAIPAGLGALVYAVINFIDKDTKISPTLVVMVSVFVWWLGWWAALHK
jgi:hypothetical protein